ncbi:hypothetical protein QOZ80_6AG0546610 [Eleusine coracana subsp. coracana]|nr:hypothetical protein QOZ80_6AG0546610 [Eleusine coracana subsp. coracana]
MATSQPAFFLLVLVLACFVAARGFDLPGVAPVDFRKKDLLAVKVGQLSSIKTQLPYSYYSLPFCRPRTVINSANNLGEVLRGDLIENSLYEFEMMETRRYEYRVDMILDNLPMVVPVMMFDPERSLFYVQGVHLGVMGMYAGSNHITYFIHNHFSFLVKYNKVAHTDLARIVAFEVTPYSVTHEFDGEWKGNATSLKTCNPQSRRLVVSSDEPQKVEANKEIIFTYDISFQESDIRWASRWDTYNLVTDDHWYSVVNSLMMRVRRRTGFRNGYSTARLYKMFRGSEWKKITIKMAIISPGIVFVIFFVQNALLWREKSSRAVPFATMFILVVLWFGISVPLVFVGSYFGFKKPTMEDPVRTNKIPRPIPKQPWYMNPFISILIGGILPFGAVLMELFFILTSIWLYQFYSTFGFLFLVFVVLILTCASFTILLCYFQLCSEDYHWWWRSYLTSGSSALYLFMYATFYFFTKLEITKAVSIALYFSYMLIVSYAFFMLTGTIGFCACFWFIRLIYSSVKID